MCLFSGAFSEHNLPIVYFILIIKSTTKTLLLKPPRKRPKFIGAIIFKNKAWDYSRLKKCHNAKTEF